MELLGQVPYSYYRMPYYHYGAMQPDFCEHQLELTSLSSHSAASTSNQSVSKQRGEHQDGRAINAETDHRSRYTYCLKIFNPDKRSKYVMEKFRRYEKFTTPQELRESLMTDYEDLLAEKDDFDIGYNEGQGASKIWIKDEDL